MVCSKYSCSNYLPWEEAVGHVSRCLCNVLRAVFVLSLTLGALSTSHAQLSSASVTGVVRDSTGSVVPNCKLVLKNVETSV